MLIHVHSLCSDVCAQDLSFSAYLRSFVVLALLVPQHHVVSPPGIPLLVFLDVLLFTITLHLHYRMTVS